jgi:hypothetical protein
MTTRYVFRCLMVLLCLWTGAALAAGPVVWDFASADGAWQPGRLWHCACNDAVPVSPGLSGRKGREP